MLCNCNDLLTDLNATISFRSDGGSHVRVASFRTYRHIIGIVNRDSTANHCVISGCHPSDPQGIWGRPENTEGDLYSGNSDYGDHNDR